MIALLDTCVLIDALQKRDGFSKEAQEIFLKTARREIDVCITAKSLLDVYYLMRKFLKDEGKTRAAIEKLLDLFSVLDTSGDDCVLALGAASPDYEDAVMVETAKRHDIDYIITRNVKHFKGEKIKILSPKQYLSIC